MYTYICLSGQNVGIRALRIGIRIPAFRRHPLIHILSTCAILITLNFRSVARIQKNDKL
jgi:hypothetical protein